MKENQDQSVKFGNIFISSASPQSQFSPMNQPPFYGPRPKYGSGFAGFLEMLSLPYFSQGYGNPEMGLDSSGSSSDRIRFEVHMPFLGFYLFHTTSYYILMRKILASELHLLT